MIHTLVDYLFTAHNTRPIGDIFKLYWHFARTNNSGVPGVILTALIYGVLIFAGGWVKRIIIQADLILGVVLFYVYFTKFHMNGRLLDIYQRLNSPNSSFFVPYDLEVSLKVQIALW